MIDGLRSEVGAARDCEQLLGCAGWLTQPNRKHAGKSGAPNPTSSENRSDYKSRAQSRERSGARASRERRRLACRCATSAKRSGCIGPESEKSCGRNKPFVGGNLYEPCYSGRHSYISGGPPRGNATDRLTTRSVYLLMATDNPTGRGAAVALQFPSGHVRFLRETFKDALDGVRDELANAKRVKDPDRLRREEAAYGRLLAALDELVIVPDDEVRALLGRLAQIIDTSNEYERVIAEHEALHGLLAQIDGESEAGR